MADFNSNYEIAQEISARLGTEPIPFESIYSLSMNIYRELGGSEEDFDDVYSILLEILPLAEELGHIIDDTSVRTDKTWSSNKINSELSNKQDTLTAGENIDITNDTISAKGYKFNGDTNGGFAEKYKQDAADGGQVVANTATGLGSHAEGYSTTASGEYGCHAEGNLTQATGYVTHAEGDKTKASEIASHAEGGETEAKANYAHAEGYQTKAIGRQSHAEGGYTKARGLRAHAEGEGASADNLCAVGDDSHTEGLFTQAQNYAEHAQGAANVSHKTASNAATDWQGDGNHTLHSIGNGRYTNTQSNAVEVMQNADVYIKGVGGYDGVHIKSEAGYETVKTLQQVIKGKQDVLTAGQNIVITNNTISAVIDAGFSVEVVQTLPTTGEVNTIYFVPKAGGVNPDVYDEYMYINNAWEKIGSTEVDLSNYYNKTEVDTLLSGKQATLTAGNNITINGNTISANDTTYSASDNIDITNNAIKAVGYRYNTTTGAFAEGDRDIDESGTARHQSVATGVMAHAEGCDSTASGNHSHTEGNLSNSVGNNSHAEGYTTTSIGTNSHSEGRVTNAIGNNSHAEGNTTTTNGADSHAEGLSTIANGYASHTEGDGTETGGNYASATTNTKIPDSRTAVAGDYAHAEGLATIAYGKGAHSEGVKTFAKGHFSHTEGNSTVAIGDSAHAEGWATKATVGNAHAEGRATEANGFHSHSEGNSSKTNSTAESSHAEGYNTETGGDYTSNTKTAGTVSDAGAYAHAEGNSTIANGIAAHAEGKSTFAKGNNSHAEGNGTKAQGAQSHAEGGLTNVTAAGANGHAEGRGTTANGYASHAEGDGCETGGNYASATTNPKTPNSRTTTTGDYSHAEGNATIAYGVASHAEGSKSFAKGANSHAEGGNTNARGNNSHAEGSSTTADGLNSHAEGRFTQTLCYAEHAEGYYNVSHHTNDSFDGNVGNTLHSIGIGTADDARKNAVEVMQNGDAYLLGVGNYDGVHIKGETGAPSGLQTLQEVVRGKQDTLGTGDNIDITNNTITALGYEFNPSYSSVTNGDGCYAEGAYSHAEGCITVTQANATYSHAEGFATETNNINEHAQGRYNVSHSVDATITQHEGNTVISVGIGEDGERRNAFEIMQNGDIYVYGLGYYDGTATKSDNPDIMTLQDILKKIADAVGVDIGALI